MSIPPQILRIKRKADEDPVDALYLHKRRATTNNLTPEQDFVFRRVISPKRNTASVSKKHQNPTNGAAGQPNGIPQLIATRPGEENEFFTRHRQGRPTAKSSEPDSNYVSSRHTVQMQSMTTAIPPKAPIPKRFLLSQISSAALVPQTGKRKREVAVFVPETASESPVLSKGNGLLVERPQKKQETIAASTPTTQARKRPGATAATPTSGTPRKKDINETSVELQNALQQYALEEFGITYGQRVVQQVQEDTDVAMKDDTEVDDAEYIYDTYERHEVSKSSMPSSSKASTIMDTQPYAPGDVAQSYGILVIPEEQEELFLEIYGEDVTSEDEGDWDSEQDDENAENYYAADYPEDEVASDDERGYGAYEKYNGRGEASDDDEYDEEVAHSADEGDGGYGVRYPWNRHQPWETRAAHIVHSPAAQHAGDSTDSSDDDDD